MKITSKINTIHYVRPIGLWFFFNVLFSPLYFSDLSIGFGFLISSTLLIFILALLHHLRKPEMRIDGNRIIYKTKFPEKQEEYRLNDILDFKWNGRPVKYGGYYANAIRLNNDYFELYFRNAESIVITADQYANFTEIRKFFYNYCLEKGIIEMRPLEERKNRSWKWKKPR